MLSSAVAVGFALVSAALAPAGEGFTQDTISEAYEQVAPAICLVTYTSEITNPTSGEATKRNNSALGLIVSPAGLVMTPGHMQKDNAEPFNINVTVGQGDDERKYPAKLLKKPDDVNICFLDIESEERLDLPYVRFQRGADLVLGQPLLLFGILSEALDFARGIFTCRVGTILEKPRRTYALDSSIRYGFVGGPVVDTRGDLVGVIGFDLTSAEGGDLYVRSGHPLVYQTDLFQQYIEHPPSESVARNAEDDGWLGVFTQPLTEDFAEYWSLPDEGGVIVSSLVPGTPAETAGIQRGDVIINFDGTAIRAKQDREVIGFTKLVRETGVGKTVTIKLLRDGQPIELEATLSSRPKSARDAGEFVDEVFGLTVREITRDVRIMLNLSEDVKGVIVRRVRSGSVAALAGMRPGIIILNLGNYPVASLDEFKDAVKNIANAKPDEVTAFCRAGTATGFFRLQPRWNP